MRSFRKILRQLSCNGANWRLKRRLLSFRMSNMRKKLLIVSSIISKSWPNSMNYGRRSSMKILRTITLNWIESVQSSSKLTWTPRSSHRARATLKAQTCSNGTLTSSDKARITALTCSLRWLKSRTPTISPFWLLSRCLKKFSIGTGSRLTLKKRPSSMNWWRNGTLKMPSIAKSKSKRLQPRKPSWSRLRMPHGRQLMRPLRRSKSQNRLSYRPKRPVMRLWKSIRRSCSKITANRRVVQWLKKIKLHRLRRPQLPFRLIGHQSVWKLPQPQMLAPLESNQHRKSEN